MKKNILNFILLSFLLINTALSQEFFEVEAEKVEFNNSENTIIAIGKAVAQNNLNKKIYSDKIIYFKKKNIILTIGNSKYQDSKVTLLADKFRYDINSKIIEAEKNVKLLDKNNNEYKFSSLKYLQNQQIISGENVKVKLADGSYADAVKFTFNDKEKITKLTNSRYTTCSKLLNNKNIFCPTWSLKSSRVKHDKKKRIITHKNAFLRIKNIPILYTPYISLPDPSVKRQSGFLPPLVKTISNIGKTVKVPYFWVISEDKDLTLTPIHYFDEKDSILSSYRQDFKTGFLNIETGYSGGYKRLNKTGRTNGSRNYFFANYKGNKKNIIFQENEIDFKIQRISQKNFVRVNKINTSLFSEDIKTLENSIKISSFADNKRLEIRSGIFENLDVTNNDKYTYLFPDGIFSYSTQKFKDIKLNFNSYFQGQKFSNNQKQFKLRNLVNLENRQIVYKKIGAGTIFKTNIYNKNVYNKNVINEKNNENIDNYFTLAVENNLPLAKFKKNNYQIVTPKIFAKYTSGKQLDARSANKILEFSDIYSMNRTNDLDIPETGFSIGHGVDYTFVKNDKDNTTDVKLSTGIGQIINSKAESKLPQKSSLNNSSTDFLGFLNLDIYGKKNPVNNPSKISNESSLRDSFNENKISIGYKYNLANDFDRLNRNTLSLGTSYDNFKGSINFDEKNDHIGNERSISLDLKKLFNDTFYVRYEGKKNLLNDNSEFHNFSLNYENDCIRTSLALSKNFYYDQDFSSSKSLILNIVIKPFSDNISPDLTSFIN